MTQKLSLSILFLFTCSLFFSCSKKKEEIPPLNDNTLVATINGERKEFHTVEEFGAVFLEKNSADPFFIVLAEIWDLGPGTYSLSLEGYSVVYAKLSDDNDEGINKGWMSTSGTLKITKNEHNILEGEISKATMGYFENNEPTTRTMEITDLSFRTTLPE
jgi:hypothetical protein